MKNRFLIIILMFIFSSCQIDMLQRGEQADSSNQRITYFMVLKGAVNDISLTQNDLPISKYLNKVTGVEVEYIHPNNTDAIVALNLLVACNNLPDIIEFDWKQYPGSHGKAVLNGLLLDLTPYLPEYTPDFYRVINENPSVMQGIKSQDGKIYWFPMVREDDMLNTFVGLVIRKDWLVSCDLEVPETIGEWETALTLFKDKMNASIPFSTQINVYKDTGSFMGAFGVVQDFYLDEGIVKYGPLEEGYYEFIKLFRDWYSKGLIDKDFGRNTIDYIMPNFLDDNLGASILSAGSLMGKIQDTANNSGKKDFLLEGAPYPVLSKGQKPKFGHNSFAGKTVAVSSTSENLEAVFKFLNYGYTKEGMLTYNFGIPSESYTFIDGKPMYTDLILNNKEITTAAAMTKYTRASDVGPFIQMKDYIFQYYKTEEQKNALTLWSNTDASKHAFPDINLNLNDEIIAHTELNELEEYVMNKLIRFTMGIDSLDSYPDFVNTTTNLSKNLLEIYQRTYDNYMRR